MTINFRERLNYGVMKTWRIWRTKANEGILVMWKWWWLTINHSNSSQSWTGIQKAMERAANLTPIGSANIASKPIHLQDLTPQAILRHFFKHG